MKKKVLLICYYFPPMGGAGVGRPLSLYKYLSRHEIECHILTVKDVLYRVYEPELLENIDCGKIYRSGSLDPQRLLYLFGVRNMKSSFVKKGAGGSSFFFPDSKVGWVKPAVSYGRDLISNNNYDLIISTAPPVSVHLVAMQLAKEARLPWIADFRDFWTSHKIENSAVSNSFKKKGRKLLDKIYKKSSVVTAVNESQAKYHDNAKLIENSFDSNLISSFLTKPKKDKFVIGLLGTYNDLYPVEPLLELLWTVKNENPEKYEQLEILQVGNVDKSWMAEQLNKYGLTDKIKLSGFLPRREALKKISEASLMYIGLDSESSSSFSTGKIFYMLASGRPILACVPKDSELSKLVNLTKDNFCFDNNSKSEALGFLMNLINKKADIEFQLPPDYAMKFSSENMVVQFADLIKSLT